MSLTKGTVSLFVLLSLFVTNDATVTECQHGNKTFQLGERIITDSSCLMCHCNERWTGTVDTSRCAIIDCPFHYYRSRPHCDYKYVPGKCCPVPTCGPWHPQADRMLSLKSRLKYAMDGINVTIGVGVEFTLFCMDLNGRADNETLVTWVHKTLEGVEKPLNSTTSSYVGRASTSDQDRSGVTFHTWGLYFSKTSVQDSGQYICTIHTDPQQTETSFMFVQEKNTKKLKDSCYENAARDLSCLYPAESHYFFNSSEKYCQYSADAVKTCSPAGNLFADDKECRQNCFVHTCQGGEVRGPCSNQFVRYFYDDQKRICKPFMYGGCAESEYGNNYETLEECQDVCEKLSFSDGTVKTLPEKPKCEPCPWHQWVHYMQQGCRPVLSEGACCPSYFDCDGNRAVPTPDDDASHQCTWNNITYNSGEDISVTDACQVCKCTKEFKGPGSPGCKSQVCGSESSSVLANTTHCVPVYSNNECCPTEQFCPQSTVYAQRPALLLHPELPELQCQFGQMKYPRGFQYKVRDQCLVCSCLTPPYFTCEHKSCAYKATEYCPYKASTDCCCTTEEAGELWKTPNSPSELAACDKVCPQDSACTVKSGADGPIQGNCEQCLGDPPNCMTDLGSPSRKIPYRCHDCLEPYTPEQACEWRNCSQGPEWCLVHTRGPYMYQTVCESREDQDKNYLQHFSFPLCNIMCSSPCYLMDSVDNGCPVCHCP